MFVNEQFPQQVRKRTMSEMLCNQASMERGPTGALVEKLNINPIVLLINQK